MAGSSDDATAESDSSADIVTIAADGDLLLEAVDEQRGQKFTYRINIAQVQNTSAYFQRLLDPKKFGEGATVDAQLKRLKLESQEIVNVPVDKLPRVQISDVGKTSKVNSIKLLFGDFLKVLHGHDIVTATASPGVVPMPLTNVANLAVVADRFDALPHVSQYIRRKRILETIDARGKKTPKSSEERLRQRLCIGVLLDHSAWVMSASQALIIAGSVRWKADADPDAELPLWWDLPLGIEDELISRRDFAVDTLQSIALHFVTIYSSGTQQCRLGYANSWVCDSFQLGEMVKFMKKHNLIKLGPVLTGQDETEPFAGDMEKIMEIFKSCPIYRMDEFHSHCGLRTRLLPLIEQLDPYLRFNSAVGIGICGDCWKANRNKYAWIQVKRPVAWSAPVPRIATHTNARSAGTDACLSAHARLRDMFMAVDRDWTPKEERSEGLRFGRTTPFLKHD